MPSGIDITRGKYATLLETTQTRPLGQRIADNKSQRIWTYVRFDQLLNLGNWVRDQVTPDLVTVDSGERYASITTDSAIGSRILTDSGAFEGEDFVGAFGTIVEGDGAGQTFFIESMGADGNEVRISLLGKVDELLDLEDERGWAVALDNADSKYVLRFPGAVIQGDVQTDELGVPFGRGFVQQPIVAADAGKYGYVCSWGLCYARILVTEADVPVMGEAMTYAGSGRVQGLGTATADEVSQTIAISQHGDLTLNTDSGDALILVDARIHDGTMAFRLTDESDPRIRTHIE